MSQLDSISEQLEFLNNKILTLEEQYTYQERVLVMLDVMLDQSFYSRTKQSIFTYVCGICEVLDNAKKINEKLAYEFNELSKQIRIKKVLEEQDLIQSQTDL